MLVEINLLPKKEPKRKSQLMWIIIMLFLLLLVGGLFMWQYSTKKEELKTTETTLNSTMSLANSYTQQLNNYKNSDSVQNLETAINWANHQSLDYVLFLQELTKNLPERGFIQELSVVEDLTVNLIVQFDTKTEAAYYLNSLLQIDWITEAVLTEAKSTDALENKINDQVDQTIELLKEAEIEPRYYASYAFVISKDKLQAEMERQKGEEDQGEEESP